MQALNFLHEGATNKAEQPLTGAIGELSGHGIEFLVCNNTLIGRKIDKNNVVMEARVVPSGVAELANLHKGFGYIQP